MKFLLTLFYITFFFLNAFSQNPLTDSLIAYYPFSSNVLDASGNGNNGTVYGATLTADRFGNPNSALSFNEIDSTDYMALKSVRNFKPVTFPFSACAWIKYVGIPGQRGMVFANDEAENYYFGLFFEVNENSKIQISFGDGEPSGIGSRRTKEGLTVLDTNWHFIAGVIRGPLDMDIYLDCKNDSGIYTGSGGGLAYDASDGIMGKYDFFSSGGPPYFYMHGVVDDVRFYHKELTESDLSIIRNYPRPYGNFNDSVSATIASSLSSICPGQQVNFSATTFNGGSSPYYQWKVNGNSTGTDDSTFSTNALNNGDIISCIVTSSQACAGTDTTNKIAIAVENINAGIISAQRDTVCPGSGTSLFLTGNTGADLQWQSSNDSLSGYSNIAGATNKSYSNLPVSKTTFYQVVVGNGVCTATTPSYKIVVIAGPMASFLANVNGSQVQFTPDTSGAVVSFYWDFGNGYSSSLANPYYNYDSVGTFNVCLTVKNNSNCNYTVCQNVTTYPTGIDEVGNLGSLNVYPDPFSSQLFINPTGVDLVAGTIEIYDVLGRDVFSSGAINMMQNPVVLDVSKLQAGMYFVWVKTKGGDYVKPLVKQ